MPTTFTCSYCESPLIFTTRRALSNHIARQAECRKQRATEYQQLVEHGPGLQHSPELVSPTDSLFDAPEDTAMDEATGFEESQPADNGSMHPDLLASEPDAEEPRRRGVEIEDITDEEYPAASAAYMWSSNTPTAGSVYGAGQTAFHAIRDNQILRGDEVLGPYRDEEEWELSKWLIKNVGHNATDEFLKLKIVSSHRLRSTTSAHPLFHEQTRQRTQPTYTNTRNHLAHLDQLPGGCDWKLEEIVLHGNKKSSEGGQQTERLELWFRDPVDCIQELLGNPMFASHMKYAPEYLAKNEDGTDRIFNEMWTGDWWHQIQVSSFVP